LEEEEARPADATDGDRAARGSICGLALPRDACLAGIDEKRLASV